ncbi:PH domain-containing protein [Eggerthellaceae bacterium zg-1084]|uniref:PH domain-containing protein n=1 Tax=Berryella wangjianweii TaxID=2734634 RepID=A0A6M8J5N0_9ACTN|nr:PH domain-containing protein [Berryella wangjianweii]NPD30303.1 PH domain-containing protein [Berryella wangjianweii]NPD32606.1 PH domain-containing protein [Eggerthellaceae bacterium zg-997]QKF06988.1 PH domain-containing protein [Berryella wangjianweii]
MAETLSGKLDPRMKNVWRLTDSLSVLGVGGGVGALQLAVALVANNGAFAFSLADPLGILLFIDAVVTLAALVAVLTAIPAVRYARWRYGISNEYLQIERGIIWRHHTVIPFIRVQDTDTKQGPVLRVFKLASVTVSTAAGAHEIPGLTVPEAEDLRQRTAELARLAHEDV